MNNQFFVLLCLAIVSSPLLASDEQKLHLQGVTSSGFFTVALYPEKGSVPIGDYHTWIIDVKDEHGKEVSNALFNISGGMAAHGHGLPSQPVVSKYLGNGQYLVEGMLFNMVGEWTLFVLIQDGAVNDRKQFDMTLAF